MAKRIARVFLERQKALLPFPKLTPDEISAILLRYAREWLAETAAFQFAFIFNMEGLAFRLRWFDIDCRNLDKELFSLTDSFLAVSNQTVASAFVSRFRLWLKEESEAWKAQGRRYVFEYDQFCKGFLFAQIAASRDQPALNDPRQRVTAYIESSSRDQPGLNDFRQQVTAYFKSRIVVPPRSLNGASPGPLIELRHRPVIEAIDVHPSLQREGSNGVECPAKLNAGGSTKRKPGPTPDGETHERVSRIVKTIAPDGNRTLKLPEICAALDSEQIPCSPEWAEKDYGSWSLCLRKDKRLVERAIEYRLSWVKKNAG